MHEDRKPIDNARPTALPEQLAEVLRAAMFAAALEAFRPKKVIDTIGVDEIAQQLAESRAAEIAHLQDDLAYSDPQQGAIIRQRIHRLGGDAYARKYVPPKDIPPFVTCDECANLIRRGLWLYHKPGCSKRVAP